MMRPLLAICALLLGGLPPTMVVAGETPAPPRLRFLFIDETPGDYLIRENGGYRPVGVEPYAVSTPYVPREPKPFALYKSLPADDGTSARTPVRIATVTPPRDLASALVIVTPRPRSSPTEPYDYRVEVVDSSPASFPAGSLRIINRSPAPMAGDFGGARVLVAPGTEQVITPATDARHRLFFKVAAQEGETWTLLSRNITVIRPGDRMTGLLVHSPGGMRHLLSAEELAIFGEPRPRNHWLLYTDSP